jgi:hypothetical protein
MKYLLEIETDGDGVAFAEEFFKSVFSVKNLTVIPEAETPQPTVDYTDMRQVRKSVNREKLKEVNNIFEKYQFSFENFKFNRDEANEYD